MSGRRPATPRSRTAPKVQRATRSTSARSRSMPSTSTRSTSGTRPGRGRAATRTGAAPRARRAITTRQPATPPPSRRHRARRAAKPAPRPASERRRIDARKPSSPTYRFSVGRPRQRLIGLLIVMTLVMLLVLFKVGRLQIAGGDELRAAGAEQWTRTIPLSSNRGTIFDRNGEELAVSIPAASISVNPKLVTDPEGTVRILTELLGLDAAEQATLMEALIAKESGFVYVRRQVDATIGEQLDQLGLVGVNVDPEDQRVLPGGETGRSVIGRTDIDGVGISGLEKQFGGGAAAAEMGYTDILSGSPGELVREVAPKGRSIAGSEHVTVEPVPGDDVILTLDRSIQFATEQALIDRVSILGAKSGYVIVQDTDTGDILAMASVQRNDEGVVEITSGNFAAVNAYEPGSVAKMVTMAAALDQKTVTPESTFVVPWRRQYADDFLEDSHQHPDELMTVQQIMVESSNIGTIDTMMSLGRGEPWETGIARRVHWEYLRAFGFGQRTALNFPDESPGILKHWTDLWGSERVTVAYGQGFSATPIQMVSAVNAIANDGRYVAPRLVAGYIDEDGDPVDADPSATHQVVSPTAAEQVQHMMRQVVCDAENGTGELAQQGVDNFSIAGKTGTGLKAQPDGGYEDAEGNRVYYASFVGFFPAEDPQVTVLVSIDEPPGGDLNHFGGTAAAPVFAELVPEIAHEMSIQPPAETTPCV